MEAVKAWESQGGKLHMSSEAGPRERLHLPQVAALEEQGRPSPAEPR